jgi:hypothetical protein
MLRWLMWGLVCPRPVVAAGDLAVLLVSLVVGLSLTGVFGPGAVLARRPGSPGDREQFCAVSDAGRYSPRRCPRRRLCADLSKARQDASLVARLASE